MNKHERRLREIATTPPRQLRGQLGPATSLEEAVRVWWEVRKSLSALDREAA